jgi:hypothetical protein
MAELMMRRAMPDFESELPRGFKPLYIEQGDMDRVVEKDGQPRTEKRYTRTIVYLDADQNPRVMPYDLGPARGRGGVTMPCAQVTEMAQVWELLDWHDRKDAELAARQEAVRPERTEAFLKSLQAISEERERQNVAQFTIGYGGKKQRSAG